MAISQDGKTLFHVELFKDDGLSGGRYRVVKSVWKDDVWSAPTDLSLTSAGHEVSPVLSRDGRTLYFASTAPGPGESEEGDLNIWYTEASGNGWSKPVFLHALNTDMADRFTHTDAAGNFYMISNKPSGNQDILITRLENGRWTPPASVTEWNSPQEEEYVSVHSELGIAFLQRSTPGIATELLYSLKTNEGWSTPVPLSYADKHTQFPYVHRAPMLSPDGGTFYFVAQGLIWQQSAAELFRLNRIARKAPAPKPLPVPPTAADEPRVFGGLKLKTNNGISFTPDMNSIFVSRYTPERDTSGNQYMKIFESRRVGESWSDFAMTAFCKPGVPFEYHPVMDAKGKRLYYNSRAPVPGSAVPYVEKNNPWYTDREKNGWSDPVMLAPLSTDHYDDYISVAKSGTLYFRSDRPGGKGAGDIYVSYYQNGDYTPPTPVENINSVHNENDVCIDPEERFIIFNRYFDRTREIRLFVSIRDGKGWSQPRVITHLERASNWELTPTLSPDGQLFFFEVNSNIFFVETRSLFSAEEWKQITKNSR